MQILQVSKFFYPHAGTETALFATRALLSANGHDVIDFAMQDARNAPSAYADYFAPHRAYAAGTPPVQRVRDALASVYSWPARKALARLLDDYHPDVAHLHIVYHQLTLSVVDELAKRGIPVVMTLHDYKVACPAYTLTRRGDVCELCIDGHIANVVRHRCIKGSVAASILAGAEARLARMRNTYGRVDAYIAPSEYVKRIAVRSGISATSISVLPNFVPDAEWRHECHEPAGRDVPARYLFAGRLEADKGVGDLLQLFEADTAGVLGELVIAGAGGSMQDEVGRVAERCARIHYLGRLSRSEVRAELQQCRALIAPSHCPETFGLAVLEARAAGRAVIVSDRGALPDLVREGEDGLIISAGSQSDLRAAVKRLTEDGDFAALLGQAGRQRLSAANGERAHYEGLIRVYQGAMSRKRGENSTAM